MRKITNFWLFKLMGVILSLSILGCTSNDTIEMLSNEQTTQEVEFQKNLSKIGNLTGEEIFRGIYFFEGDIPYMIPSMEAETVKTFIENLDEDIKLNLEDFKQELVSKIYQNNANFFEEFKKDITSGNHFKVKEALERSMFEYEKVIMSYSEIDAVVDELEASNLQYEDFIDSNGEFDTELYKSTLDNLFDDYENTEFLFCAAIVAAVVVIIYYGAAIAGAVGVVGGIYLWVAAGQYIAFAQHYTEIISTRKNALKVEVFIDEISNNLYVEGPE